MCGKAIFAVSGGVFSTTKSEHHHRDPARLDQLIPVRLHFFMTPILFTQTISSNSIAVFLIRICLFFYFKKLIFLFFYFKLIF
jgi:hypothetical protein